MCTFDVQVKFYDLGIRGFDDIQILLRCKKGRTKGTGLTVIGLPKKANYLKPTPFVKSEWEKSKHIINMHLIKFVGFYLN